MAGFWSPKKFSVEGAASLQQELRDPEGFQSLAKSLSLALVD
jgi:hypothetical protein